MVYFAVLDKSGALKVTVLSLFAQSMLASARAHTRTHPPQPNVLLTGIWVPAPTSAQVISTSPRASVGCSGPYFCLQPSSLLSSYLSSFHDSPFLRCPKLNSRFSPQIYCFLIFPLSGNGTLFIPTIAQAHCSETCFTPLSTSAMQHTIPVDSTFPVLT